MHRGWREHENTNFSSFGDVELFAIVPTIHLLYQINVLSSDGF